MGRVPNKNIKSGNNHQNRVRSTNYGLMAIEKMKRNVNCQ